MKTTLMQIRMIINMKMGMNMKIKTKVRTDHLCMSVP